VRLGTTVADAFGRYRMVVTVPLGTSPGLHTIRVSVVGGTLFAETTLVVTAPVVVAQRATPVLSRTGGNLTTPAGMAFVLMVAGFVLVGLSWNRRPVRPAARRSPWPNRRRWL
jgi:hypothetical protein